MWINHVLFIHLRAHGHWDCFYFLAVIDNTAMNIHMYVLCGHMFSFRLARYLVMKWLSHSTTLCLTSQEIAKLVPKGAATSYIPTSSVRRFQCPHDASALNSQLSWISWLSSPPLSPGPPAWAPQPQSLPSLIIMELWLLTNFWCTSCFSKPWPPLNDPPNPNSTGAHSYVWLKILHSA